MAHTDTYRSRLTRTSGLKIVRNGDHAWTVTIEETGARATGSTRRQAVEIANRLRSKVAR